MFVYDSAGHYRTSTPTCQLNPVQDKYCFDLSKNVPGDSVTVTALGYNTDSAWEMYWKALDVATGTTYTGTHLTSMTFVLKKNNGIPEYSIALLSSTNLQPNNFDW